MDSLKIADINCDIVGADRGFNVSVDILTQTADGVSLNPLWNEFSTALAEWNKTRVAISALSSRTTTESFAQLPLGSSNVKFEKQSEFGVPQASRVKPDYTRMGFPLDWSDSGLHYMRKFLRDATAEQVRARCHARSRHRHGDSEWRDDRACPDGARSVGEVTDRRPHPCRACRVEATGQAHRTPLEDGPPR
ncbi:hypothetical protein [Microbacterium sp. RURRCA19A]|uniref:hypothetical protein n=1 Tax=Microbacterium sp. RURRCA19A TaxID=1907391 RepID=UPI001115A2F4|nr:hypothetical protein [Microbacterium sp. RURRCA19A]